MISEILPVFSRKPIFGYTFIAWSGVAIGFLSFTVWAHHMFAVGLPAVAQAFFATSTTLIAIPTAVKIFNWLADRKSTRLNSSHSQISYAVFCLKKKNIKILHLFGRYVHPAGRSKRIAFLASLSQLVAGLDV